MLFRQPQFSPPSIPRGGQADGRRAPLLQALGLFLFRNVVSLFLQSDAGTHSNLFFFLKKVACVVVRKKEADGVLGKKQDRDSFRWFPCRLNQYEAEMCDRAGGSDTPLCFVFYFIFHFVFIFSRQTLNISIKKLLQRVTR